MPKLYLVGITEDRSGLVLAKSPRAKKGDSVLEVDHVVLDALAEIRRYRSEGTTRPSISSPALPSRRITAGEVSTPSALSPREIQARLRRGESIASVARRAGVEEWRIRVYATPITAEHSRVVGRARDLYMVKRGSGASGRPLGESVQANIVDKRVSMNADEFEAAWSAYEPEADRWVVVFEYVSRGTLHRAEWIYEEDEQSITPANRAATSLGWRDPRRTGRLAPLPDAPRVTTAKRPTRAKKAGAKKAGAKKAGAKKAGAKRAGAKKPAARTTAAKRSTAKRAAAKKKTAARRAPARKPAARKPTARKPAGKKAPARTAATRKTGSKRATPKKGTAKRASAKKGTAKKGTARKSSRPRGAARRAPSQPRHLRIVDAPPDTDEPVADDGNWPAPQPGPRRLWRESADDDLDLDDDDLVPPSWLGGAPRREPESDEHEVPDYDEPRVARTRGGSAADSRRGVSVNATPVAGRRRPLRRRERPLRPR